MTERSTESRRPTIKQVASLAGVSHQTVSRYLRSRNGLKPATLARIDAAVSELNYRPNLVARSMRTRRTGRLAILLPTMVFNPSRMLHGATEAAHEAGFTVEAISVIGDTETRTERMLEIAGTGQVEGILALAPVSPGIEDHLPQGETIVVAADFDDQMRGIGELADAAPLVEIMEGLVAFGHRRFFHVAGNLQFASARARKAAYLETVERLGLESAGVVDGDWSGRSGYDAVHSLADEAMPTAVIAANDVVAAGAIRALIERGLDIPGDASVTGWDSNEVCEYLPPSLTSVEVNLEGLGRNAMLSLVKAISGRELEPAPRPLQRVAWRESTGPTTPR
ncbi:LacI family DNA-binding transcriptional regulator [Glycomyces tritici]|uniref:LacI family DNA-binding transcriptional regulator n=1 Tax=Glycomyces tritici TaxID=2665176 RepID=A0ABT7YT38_9ACTN|nr:LacI family DNA-binding transcriptional regulator [Glycomyces tritici]MDN3241428.1 LacI family DNA-binding transcriptional regulator [Glycomyces tritici]MDN3242215.1 LacI family DNA-binding transcriptional regulator [Glycomyces tritici]